MRNKLESLPLAVLKDLAKDKGVKGFSTLKKAELIEEILKLAQEEQPAEKEDKVQKQDPAKEVDNNDLFKQDYDPEMLDKGPEANGILEVMPEGYGFIRCENFLPGENDVYVSHIQIRRFGLKSGDIVVGPKRIKNQGEKFSAILYIKTY